MNGKYMVTGNFRLLSKSGGVLRDQYTVNVIAEASSPEDAEKKAIAAVSGSLASRYHQHVVMKPILKVCVKPHQR